MDRWSFYCQAMCGMSGMRSVQVCGMYAFAIWDKKNNTCPLSEAEWMFRLPKREECDVPEKRCFLGSLWLWQKNDSLANSAFKSSPVPHIRRSEKTLRGRQRILIAFFMRMLGWLFLTFHVLFVFCPYFVITKLVRSTRCFHVFLKTGSGLGGTSWHVIQLESFLCTLDGGGARHDLLTGLINQWCAQICADGWVGLLWAPYEPEYIIVYHCLDVCPSWQVVCSHADTLFYRYYMYMSYNIDTFMVLCYTSSVLYYTAYDIFVIYSIHYCIIILF